MNFKYKVGTFLSGVFIPLMVTAVQVPLHRKGKPNIIYILADDMGRADLGCYGQKIIETPNIDALADAGMIFTNHYAGQAVSAPSRCSLFTGLHMGHAYIRGNDEMGERGDVWSRKAMLADSTLEGQRPMPAATITIPKKLKEGGYVTGCIGKWGLGSPGSQSTPNKMGFDFFYGYNCQRMAHTYYPPYLYRNECREYLHNQLVEPEARWSKHNDPFDERNYLQYVRQDYAPDRMYKEILRFVNEHKEVPFALFWTTPLPHMPLQVPQKWVEYYHKKIGDEKPYLGNNGFIPCRYPHATYAAMIGYLDEQIGNLVEVLKHLDLFENTLIIFTSDNGAGNKGGSDSPFFQSSFPHRSATGWEKASLREGGIRVPMIACWPKEIEKGSRSDLLSAFWDMMPTFCEIAEVEAPHTDGLSMLPTFKGKGRKQKKHEYLYWEFPGGSGQKALRMGHWKAFVQGVRRGNQCVELYDVNTDPGEKVNVADEYPDVVAHVLEVFREAHEVPEIGHFDLPVW